MPDPVERPLAVQAPAPMSVAEPVPAAIPVAEPVQPPEEPALIPPASENNPPLKDVLLEALKSSIKKKYTVDAGDSLGAIAKRNHVTLEMLKSVNNLKSDRIRVGQKLMIPAAHLRITIDKSQNRLRLFNGEALVRTYPVATGDRGVTEAGSYKVVTRLIQPTWYWQGYAVTPDDPDYPLGTRWLGLSRQGYGIHGTNEPESIGKQASHGCIRMYNVDVEELFDVVPIGTPVKIAE